MALTSVPSDIFHPIKTKVFPGKYSQEICNQDLQCGRKTTKECNSTTVVGTTVVGTTSFPKCIQIYLM